MSSSAPRLHERAFEEFAVQARGVLGASLHELVLFGSTARGETNGIESDVDIFAVVDTERQEEMLLEFANAVGLEYGVFLSVHTQTVERFEARKDHPFIRTILEEGRAYV